jgi:hypothetical protein
MALSNDRKRTCFVVMPFGEKNSPDGQDIDFDDIYRFFFRKAIDGIDGVDIECLRCDEIEESGSIHEKMFEHIYHSDVVVCDITTANPNVFYELGIRHALAKGVTVLIRRKGTNIPFNIQGLQVVEYDQSKFSSIEQAKTRIQQIIKNGLNQKRNDSPVQQVLDLNIEPEGKPIEITKIYEAPLASRTDCAIGLVTGDIQNVTGIDVWVNSENTNMQMARPFENSISGVIRYLGAKKDRANGQIEQDTIVEALARKMGKRTSVDPATVLDTTAGSMEQSNKVKRIYHAAANYGQVGQGYVPIDYVARCVTAALKTIPDHEECPPESLQSILFPLMATRAKRGALLEDQIRPLLNAAIEYLSRNPDCIFRKVYFLTYTDKELEVCRAILSQEADSKDDKRRLLPLVLQKLADADATAETPVTRGPGSGLTGRSVTGTGAAPAKPRPRPAAAVDAPDGAPEQPPEPA